MAASAGRHAQNEALFRDLNERVREIDQRLEPNGMGAPAAELEFLCECSDLECVTRFVMSRSDYEAVRRDPSHFLVIPEHVNGKIEDVVEIRPGYVIVSKSRVAGEQP
jgi:hypothetical protein